MAGIWSSTFGGGNSFSESVANVFTPDDGQEYQGGSLVDTNKNSSTYNTVISGGTADSVGTSQNNASVGSTSTGHGKTIIDSMMGVGSGDSGNKVKGQYKPSSTTSNVVAGVLTGGMSALPKIFGGFASWANGLDPKADATRQGSGVVDGRQVYTSESGMSYSYNFLNMPYEVKVMDGKVVDALAIDASGKAPGTEGYNPNTTKYAENRIAAQNNNDGDGLQQIQQYEDANSGEGEGEESGGTSNQTYAERILEMAKEAGFTDIKGTQKEIIADAAKYLKDRGLNVEDNVPELDAATEGTIIGDAQDLEDINMGEVNTVTDGATVDSVDTAETTTYDVTENVITDDMLAEGVTGEIDSDNLVDASDIEIDIAAEAAGDGVMGNTLDQFASQNISTIIDTSTADGKMLAQALGEGNYTDHKATIMGQIEIISKEFKDSNGNPRIPSWAQSSLRNIQQTVAFGGMSGTAATAAYANAIMEATLGIADKEAKFFQTVTIENLDHRQEAVINKAKILAQFELGNLDAREAAAVQNAKAFLEMDLTNLSNAQQAMVINKQAMVDALFRNTEAINAQALFTAEERNDMAKFYDELNATIQRHNITEMNALKKFNVGEINDNSEFLADIKNDRQQFVSRMQYNIDVKNAEWRQEVANTNNQNQFDAASTDIKNALDLTQEAQNALWDDADNILDYIWKSADNDQQRELLLLTAQLKAQSGQQDSGNDFLKMVMQIGGSVLGASDTPWWLA